MTKPFVLIVEDDPQLGNIYTLTLQADFETQLCTDGLEAIAQLDQLSPALIILDLHLPGASGQEVLAQITTRHHLAKTRIILATADHNQAAFLEDDATIVLLKPISPLQLRDIALRLCQPSS